MNPQMSKLVIGTAQWGLDYGISNNEGKTKQREIKNILEYLEEKQVNSFDTARAYGDAEHMLGKLTKGSADIITKLSIGNQGQDSKSLRKKVEAEVRKSMSTLRKVTLDSVLVHDPEHLVGRKEYPSWEKLRELKESQYIKKIGISVYCPNQAERLVAELRPDIIQIPMNAFDQRAIKTGTIMRLKKQGVEIHARSLFLQGLLLMPKGSIDKYFVNWVGKIEEWHKYCKEMNWTLLEGALTYTFTEKNVDKCIVGIANMKQIVEIVNTLKRINVHQEIKDFSTMDEMLINPSNWKIDK